jgi:hypothetical protein
MNCKVSVFSPQVADHNTRFMGSAETAPRLTASYDKCSDGARSSCFGF